MRHLKKILAVAVAIVVIASVCVVGSLTSHASGTGAGLAEWALNAYNSGWKYVYGGSSAGAVDCSGLIYSYCGGARVGSAQLSSATSSGNVSAGIPRVHGLGLYQPGHVGVYVGGGMAVDARNEHYGVCYESTANKSWTKWFKLSAVNYVTNGWEKFNGNYYYYEDGQYIVNTSRSIGGETYHFSSSGISDKTPSDMGAVANKSSRSDDADSAFVADTSKKKSGSSVDGDFVASKQSNVDGDFVASSGSSAIKLGSSGDKVTKLQNRLTELGFYSDAVTGYFGEATQAAYKKFQKAAGVTVDGIAGKSDLEILYSDKAPTASSKKAKTDDNDDDQEEENTERLYQSGDNGDDIAKIQTQLQKLGYYDAAVTGFYGNVTKEAVLSFQRANNITDTGAVGEETWAALFSKNAVKYEADEEETQPETEAVTEEEAEAETETEAETEQQTESEVAEQSGSAETEASQSAETVKKNPAVKLAEDNIEAVKKVAEKTIKLNKKALSHISDKNDGKTVSIASDEKNTNFVLWLLLVLGAAALITGVMFTFNRRGSAYNGSRSKNSKKDDDVPVRYW
jgi:peptidoglycan hydrolase-like protein with peptidoglycan-binding domain